MQAAADGLGLAIGYRELIDYDLNIGKLVIACDQPVKHPYSYYLVYRPDQDNVSVDAFKQWLMTS